MQRPLRASGLAPVLQRFLLVPLAAAALSVSLARAQEEGTDDEPGKAAVQIQIDNQSGRDWKMEAVPDPLDGHQFSELDKLNRLKLYNPAAKRSFTYPGTSNSWTLPKGALAANVKNLGKNKKRALHFKLKEGKHEATFCLYSNGGKLKLFLEKASLMDDTGTEIFELNQPQDGGLVIRPMN
jgi:hypothetical protein